MAYVILYFLIGYFIAALTIFIYKFLGVYDNIHQFDFYPPIFFVILFWPLTIILHWPTVLIYKLKQKVKQL